nr:hypothetical protein [Palleronia aestuarii]
MELPERVPCHICIASGLPDAEAPAVRRNHVVAREIPDFGPGKIEGILAGEVTDRIGAPEAHVACMPIVEDKDVGAGPAEEEIDTAATHDRVVTPRAEQNVATAGAFQEIILGAALERAA